MSTAKWDPHGWLKVAVLMQEKHPFVPVELNREQAVALLKYIEGLLETLEETKRQLGGTI